MPRNVEHDARAQSDGSELAQRLDQLLAPVLARLQQLGDDGDGANVQERPRCEGQQQVTVAQTGAPDAAVQRQGLGRGGPASKLLDGDADAGAEQGADGGDELGAHGGLLGKPGLHEESEVADLVGDLVEENGHGGCCADSRGGVEGC